MKIFSRIKKNIDKVYAHECTFQKVQAEFTNILGETFKSCVYKWAKRERLLCSVPDYIMVSVNEDGYIKDENGVLHFLSNIVKMDWKVVEEKKVICGYSDDDWKIFYTDLELEEISILEKDKVGM